MQPSELIFYTTSFFLAVGGFWFWFFFT